MLDCILCDETGVICAAAGNHDDLVDFPQLLVRQAHFVQREPSIAANSSQQCLVHSARLLGNFFQHEVLEAAFLSRFRIPGDFILLRHRWGTVEGGYLNGARAQIHYLVLPQLNGIASVRDES
ncbi:hypothetical protein GALL_450530 [mine drainage metagenome]|uniref:Uncharacterized protein n=1 Tax=mine drainage metagenome TaxID=410659 RepID=A0A1J5QBH5_9ZZZZ